MKALVVHGGGPTPVINASLLGVINAGKKNNYEVYAAKGGMAGFLAENFVRLDTIADKKLNLLLSTPSTVIGTSRTPLVEEDFYTMVDIAKKHDIEVIIANGGNGTMHACGKIAYAAKGTNVKVMGIPKTIDNDIAITDHCPGFGSAARYLNGSLNELITDVKGMPIHVSVVETMGRNVGWITASAKLSQLQNNNVPHLIYVPEVSFKEDEFLEDVENAYKANGYAVVVASEGLTLENGNSIVEPIFRTDRAIYFGDVGTHLATLIIKKLGIKARSEKPGIFGRSSIAWQSSIDRQEAYELGEMALVSAIEGNTGYMTGLKRINNSPYQCPKILIPVEEVMMIEKNMPLSYINERGNGIEESFVDYVKPLIGEELPKMFEL